MLEIRLSGGEDSWPKRRPYMTHRRYSLENAWKNHKKYVYRVTSSLETRCVPKYSLCSNTLDATATITITGTHTASPHHDITRHLLGGTAVHTTLISD